MKETFQIAKLSEVLMDAEKFDGETELFWPRPEEWDINTPCAVLKTDEVEKKGVESIFEFAEKRGFSCSLALGRVQIIVAKVKKQRPRADLKMMLHALQFYFDNKTYLNLEARQS